ncbi:hypothetical protein [Desulfobaculum bizertense]|uniref:Nickel transport protein n=1 Tax=Desulfobaculum bizertense DSM 18034 TaxID=1121442 RepID=A0A1T4W7F0_9BACT|nr:hypothetical protein [Desulfobaculum bizertense]SKA73203.1 nickel transport protein [Desulfobaculum bizertense DSM 18034]
MSSMFHKTLRVLFCLCLCGLISTPAFAHRVNVFAWPENSTIHTESTFSGGKKAQNSKITVTAGSSKEILISGTTDSHGEFSFELPQSIKKSGQPLHIHLDAGVGHVSTLTLEPADYLEEELAPTPLHQQSTAPNAVQLPQKSDTDIERIVREAVRKEMTPVLRFIAKAEQPGPQARDIFAGIGYIFGLFGVAALVKNSRKK